MDFKNNLKMNLKFEFKIVNSLIHYFMYMRKTLVAFWNKEL